ncbi:MAG: hypothetical protein ABW174_07520 [Flavitalea sp.]
MKIHLIRSNEYSEQQFTEVLLFLNSFDGPVSFIDAGELDPKNASTWEEEKDEDEFFHQEFPKKMLYHELASRSSAFPVSRKTTDWENLFAAISKRRSSVKIPKDEMLILLTTIANENNWFSAVDPNNRANGFVHTAEWEYYVRCSGEFPVAYLTAALLLQSFMFKNYAELKQAVHEFPMGCVNDFCEDKRNIILKLRTADICPDCIERLNGKLDDLVIRQMLDIFEGVRLRMLFHQKFRHNLKQSVLKLTKKGQILLPDFGNIEIRLTPLEKTLYHFFLAHPEGVLLTHLVDHKEELVKLYFRFTNTGELPKIYKSIDDLVDNTSNSANEKLSKIKKAFVSAIGAELAEQYIVTGERGEIKKLSLSKDMIVVE